MVQSLQSNMTSSSDFIFHSSPSTSTAALRRLADRPRRISPCFLPAALLASSPPLSLQRVAGAA
ncbi:hypothetical protein ACOSQ2_013342 [Xanthoceras sorbifolium]